MNKTNTVPEETVVAVSQETPKLSESQAIREIERIGASQPALYRFAAPLWLKLRPNAMRVCISLFVTIVRIFERHFGERLQRVGSQQWESMVEAKRLKLESLIDPSGRSDGRLSAELRKHQPEIWAYVAYCLYDAEYPGFTLSGEERGQLSLLFVTVIEALNNAVRPMETIN